jgi:YD repeat-containing protein
MAQVIKPVNETQTNRYDGLNRLTSASEAGGWSRTYGQDAWGNMWGAAWTGFGLDPFTPVGASNFLASGQTVSDNRLRIQNSAYNGCGEMTAIGAHNYSYTGEGQVASMTLNGGTVSHGYDGDGLRVLKRTVAPSS